MVFMGHGLALSFFMMTTVVAAAALWRGGERIRGFSFAAWRLSVCARTAEQEFG